MLSWIITGTLYLTRILFTVILVNGGQSLLAKNEEEEKTLLSGKNERQQNYLKDPYIGPTHLVFF